MELEQTADGSYTLYVPELDEHYHSVKGALTESQHIFIEMGLKHSPVAEPRILEIGLGTGLNAFLTLLTAEEIRKKVYYTGIERYPLSEDTVHKLNYPGLIGKGHEDDYYAIHRAGWETDEVLSPWFTLHKIEGDFTRLFHSEEARQNSLYEILNKGGILTTYCAKGIVRRMLQAAGFTVERLPGPPGGKREILRATK